MSNRIQHYMEYVLLRTVGAIVCILPYRLALLVGWMVAVIGYLLIRPPIRRAEARVRASIRRALSPWQTKRIIWIAWRNLIFNGVDLLRAPRHNLRWIENHTDYHSAAAMLGTLKSGESAIIAVPHMGSWEAAGLSLAVLGVRTFTIVRNLRNPLMSQYVNRIRSRTGQLCMDRHDPMLARKALRKLKEGFSIVLMPDLRAPKDALYVEFLNGEAVVPGGAAMFSHATGIPVQPACVLRDGWAKHRWVVFDCIEPDLNTEKKKDWQRITQETLRVFDEMIQKHPEQYFWFNKRWVLDPIRKPQAPKNPNTQ